MRRFINNEDILITYQLFADQAVARYNETGQVPPQLFVVTLAKEAGKFELIGEIPSTVVANFYENNTGKNKLINWIHQLLNEGSRVRHSMSSAGLLLPDLVIHVSEAWVKKLQAEPGSTSEDVAKSYGESGISNEPDKEEAIIVAIHFQDGSEIGFCPINKGFATFASINQSVKLTGRFIRTNKQTQH